ncbi:MAG TPA: SpoIIE family protein phosphatase [Mycobacteriales bacterium]|nr:SpoIIE family protein phosphatase [Mycobacteriales bacterium]
MATFVNERAGGKRVSDAVACSLAARRHDLPADAGATAIRAARGFVERQVVERRASNVDDVTLAAAELLANAVQHGAGPIAVTVSGGSSCIRIEVSDGSRRAPVRPAASATNMTGRGIALVEGVATRWGVERREDGKTVWAEFDAGASPDPQVDIDRLLAAWDDDAPEDSAEPHFTVVLGDVPTDLLIEAKSHIDNLVREFSLAASAGVLGEDVPDHLAGLIQTVVYGFSAARDAIKRQALAAARRGEVRTNLMLRLPERAADAGEAYLAALDEADSYARAARLLTLEAPASHRLFRRWYVEAVVRGIRDGARGLPPAPVVPFETRMLEEVERLTALQRSTDRAARLQRVTAALANTRAPEDVAAVVVSEGVAALDAAGGGLLVPAADGIHVAVPGVVGYGEALVGALRDERLDAPLPAATALRTGKAVWLESREERDREFPALRGFEASTQSMCAVPLLAGGRILGALRFSFATRRLFGDNEREFVLALAAQTAQTLLRTEIDAAERKAALNLQRALLPERTPRIDGWSVAAHYSPAGQHEAGGDFYDVLRCTDGRVVAVVGDVMGRGIEAAASMAQIRSAVLAYAVEDPAPAAVFAKIDAFFAAVDPAQLVTLLYLLIEPATGEVEIASAGHLPPISVGPAGNRIADARVGAPLGIDIEPRQTTLLRVPRGAGIVALTDGLVERRGQDIEDGVRRLLAATSAAGTTADADELLRQILLAAPGGGGQDDDVTVLALFRH